MCALVMMASAAFAADPGTPFPAASELSDQKAGSVLFYVFYNSSTTSPNQTNTKMSITNTSITSAAFVHLFFVASNCSVADRFMCLTASQTASFTSFDEDPGIQGYLIVVAADGVNGCPVSFNFLIGDEFIKNGGTHQANLGAEAFSALYQGIHPECGSTIDRAVASQVIPTTVTLRFDGVQYNKGGKVLAIASIPSFLDSNDTRLIVVRVGGDLVAGPRNIGTIFGLMFNDAEDGFSYSFSAGCQVFQRLTNDFPRTVPRFTEVIPQNQTGWTKFWTNTPAAPAIIGAVLNYNPNAATSSSAFTGGHTLHKLTLTNDAATMPIFPPTC